MHNAYSPVSLQHMQPNMQQCSINLSKINSDHFNKLMPTAFFANVNNIIYCYSICLCIRIHVARATIGYHV